MPNIYYLNTPPHPFWDFVAGIEDHPFFAQPGQPGPPPPPARPGAEHRQTSAQASTTTSDKTKGKQAEAGVEDPPEVDPATVRPGHPRDMPFRGRGRFAHAFDETPNKEKHDGDNDGSEDRHRGKRGCHGHRRGFENGAPWGRRGGPPFGPPPFLFGPNFPFGPHGPFGRPSGPGQEEHEGQGESRDHGHGLGPHPGFRGRGGPHRGRFGHHPRHGPHGHHPHHEPHGAHARSPPRSGPFAGGASGFDLPSFLTNLGERLGVDLTSAAEGLGLGLSVGQKHSRSADRDFEPRTDIFDSPQEYTVHVSLPGAKKSDLGVDWDGEHSVLRIAGVVHRPGVDEEMMSRLVVDGRKRETGVFEKTIRLGTTKAPAAVDVEGISAKMVDGVLVVRVPKVEKRFAKKEVHVDSSPSSPPAVSADGRDRYTQEKQNDLLFDADEDGDMYDGTAAPQQRNPRETAEAEVEAKGKGKQRGAEDETIRDRERDDRSETIGFEYPHTHPDPTAETLPRYQLDEPAESKLAKEEESQRGASEEKAAHEAGHDDDNMSDWERDGSEVDAAEEDEGEDEGEYEHVKINVD
ncbi:hypothetical protein A1O7_02041 [Cladophialophora yegresii CBS 114405]|uniref:SHSP domain-containing protein n=1 Tax=Cladophialophora yegresii CBS 114405 TaxID=1182544 RepID=W9W0Z1_9EURO|nr:uncharacterized protein A1O7_02041 [Cladophialophora yegresii CBS 114405]EXJ61613.1 hypothetical protein A1O7_02041 [Cladophialophora yegresii CBS 114405]